MNITEVNDTSGALIDELITDKVVTRVEIHTDGSLNDNALNVGGASFIIVLRNKSGDIIEVRNGAVASNDLDTPSKNEVVAIIEGLNTLLFNPFFTKYENNGKIDLKIFSDNEKAFTEVFANNAKRLQTWKKNDWIKTNGEPVALKNEYINISNLFYLIRETGIYNHIGVCKVAAHENRTGNELADQHAKQVVDTYFQFQQPTADQ